MRKGYIVLFGICTMSVLLTGCATKGHLLTRGMEQQGKMALQNMGFYTMHTDPNSGVETMEASKEEVQAKVGTTAYSTPALNRLAEVVANKTPVYGFAHRGQIVAAGSEATVIMTSEDAARELYPYRYGFGNAGNYAIDGAGVLAAIAGLIAGGQAINESISGGSSKEEDHSITVNGSNNTEINYATDQSRVDTSEVPATTVVP